MDTLRAAAPLAAIRPDDFARDLLEGLTRSPKEIACKYFYDAEGSRLFDAICELPEYYQTRTETALLAAHAAEIAAWIGPEAEIVEFGAGSMKKIRLLLDVLQPRGEFRREPRRPRVVNHPNADQVADVDIVNLSERTQLLPNQRF